MPDARPDHAPPPTRTATPPETHREAECLPPRDRVHAPTPERTRSSTAGPSRRGPRRTPTAVRSRRTRKPAVARHQQHDADDAAGDPLVDRGPASEAAPRREAIRTAIGYSNTMVEQVQDITKSAVTTRLRKHSAAVSRHAMRVTSRRRAECRQGQMAYSKALLMRE